MQIRSRRHFMNTLGTAAAATAFGPDSGQNASLFAPAQMARTGDRLVHPRKVLLWECTRKEIREALETMAVKLACQRATKEQIDKAVSYYDQMVEAIMNRKYDEYTELHSQFHEALYSPCGNEQLLSLIRTFRYQYFNQRVTQLYTRVFNNTLDTRSQVKKHRRILEALCERNVNKAEKALIRHLRTTLKLAVQLY